jgi:hypothetical protein
MAVAFDPASQRLVAADCLTDAGWVRGRFHVPATQSFTDFLTHTGAFLPMTDALLPHADGPRPFFAIQTGALHLAVPDPGDAHLETTGGRGITSPWSVHCLLAGGTVEGSIDFITNQRLSDYLKAARGVLLVREATWTDFGLAPGGAGQRRQFPVVLVNVARIVGIADALSQRGHGHPGALARGGDFAEA